MKKLTIAFAVAVLFCACDTATFDAFSTVCGVITDEDTQSPVDGASVFISPGGNSKITGSNGYFEFQDLEARQYTITVQKNGYNTNRRSVTAIAGETHEISITLSKQ